MAFTKEEIIETGIMRPEKVVDPRSKKDKKQTATKYKWYLADNDNDLLAQLLSTVEYLKRTNNTRIRQASIFSRLFSGKPLYNFLSSNASLDTSNQLPIGRPTANVCYSCTDTLTSRITQDKPKPIFLTDGGDYKERKLAKEANKFIQGELYRLKAYEIGPLSFKDSCILGNGFLKVFPENGKVQIERVLETELLTDFNDAYYNKPRELYQLKLVDREVIMSQFPKKESILASAAGGTVDSTPRSVDTISDQLITVEAWRLPSSPDADDGVHVIACSEGIILKEKWNKSDFPFVKISYNTNMVGFFSQGLIEILMPTQMEIYRQLIIGSQAFELMGTPKVLIDEMSKILETSFNNRIGTIIKYRTTPPEFVTPNSMASDWLPFVEWLIQNAYQMSGISQLSAGGIKPSGLNSGEAQREYMDTQNERFNMQSESYRRIFVDLSYKIIDCAKDIYEETGKYNTVYPGKDGTSEIDFKTIRRLKDTFVIQCYEESSLPKDPAGRQAKLSEMRADGEISFQEFRRLSNFPDLEQSDQLANALEERILHALDEIIENGDKNYASIAPDSFILDPTDMASTIAIQYINKYSVTNLEEEKMEVLTQWWEQVQNLKQNSMPPPQIPTQPTQTQALPVVPPNASLAPSSGAQV